MIRRLRREWPEVLVVILLAAIVYQPWSARALPLTDFGTFLPLIDATEPIASQVASVFRHMRNEGRLQALPYLLIVLDANAFGTSAAGWYWSYFAQCAAVITLTWLLLRRTGVIRPAAFIALAMWALMLATTELWLRPTGEPMALMMFLAALHLLLDYGRTVEWKRCAWIVALLVTTIVFSKEILVALLPAAWLVSRLDRDGAAWTWRPWGVRDTYLLAIVGLGVVISMAPVAYVALTAQAGSYVSQFGADTSPFATLGKRLGMILLPTKSELPRLARIGADPEWTLLLLLPNLIWIRLILGGAWVGSTRLLWPLAISVLWGAVGVIAYMPWPHALPFYMAPFALGAMFGAAHILSALMERSRRAMASSIILAAGLVCVAAVEAHTVVLRHGLRARLNAAVIEAVAERGPTSLLASAVPAPPVEQRWSWARNLEGFAKFAKGTRVAASRDITCDEARHVLRTIPGSVVVSREKGCGKLTDASAPLDANTWRAEWPWLWERHLVADRMYVTRSARTPASPLSDRGSAVRPGEASL